MRCYWLILAAIALWLLPLQVIAEQRPVLGQGNLWCSLWLEVGRLTALVRKAERAGFLVLCLRLINTGRRVPTCLRKKH